MYSNWKYSAGASEIRDQLARPLAAHALDTGRPVVLHCFAALGLCESRLKREKVSDDHANFPTPFFGRCFAVRAKARHFPSLNVV